MSSIDYMISYEPNEVIISVGYFSGREIKALYAISPPVYLEAYEPRLDIYNQYLSISKAHRNFVPKMTAVTGDGRSAYLTSRRCNTTICLPKSAKSSQIKTVSLSTIIRTVFDKFGAIDKLLMNCEGSEIDIIKKTPSEILKRCRKIVVSFHVFVTDFNISKIDYENCLKKLSITHTGVLLHKTRYWWEFKLNG